MIVNFYLLILAFFKLLLAHQLFRENTFYFVFWRAVLYFEIFLTIIALSANIIWSSYSFSSDISNFLYPLLDFFYFSIFLIFFLLFVGKYIPTVSSRYFYSTMNFLLFFSVFYSFLSLYIVVIQGHNVSLPFLLFPFGSLIKSIWIVGPLFGAFYWSKLKKSQKIILIISILSLFLLTIPSGRRSSLLFIIFFLIFWCWKKNYLKKIILILVLFFFYSLVEGFHLQFKEYTRTNSLELKLSERIEKVLQSDQSRDFINDAVQRILHQYMLTESVHKELQKTEGVGLKPFKTAIYSIIPSQFLNSKPWPGSIDGTKYSSFGYLVNDIAFNIGTNMSEYPISLEFVWHGSYLLALTSFILSIFIMVAFYRASVFFGDRLVILPLLAVYPGDYNFFQPGIIKLIQMFAYIYLPGFIILFFLIFLKYLSGSNSSDKNAKLPINMVDK